MAPSVKLLDRHPGGSHGFGVSDALVAQRIELAGHHEAGGKPSSLPRSGETRGSVRSAGEQYISQNQNINERVRK